jgi:hypothetical protein
MTSRRASCTCGQLAVTAGGEPVRISVCHCLACQQRTGSAFGVQARFPQHQVAIEGQATRYDRTADSGNQVSLYFCPRCGATVYYQLAVQPDLIAIPVGAFADPSFPEPRISIYEDRRHRWVRIQTEGPIEHLD